MNRIIAIAMGMAALAACGTAPSVEISRQPMPIGAASDQAFAAMAGNARQEPAEIGRVYFDYDADLVKPESREQLAFIAREVNRREGPVVVEGHADHMNTDGYNLRLGYRRALAVAHYLRSAGVAADRMHIKSFGEDRAAGDNHSESERPLNRRVVVRMFAQGDRLAPYEHELAEKALRGAHKQEAAAPSFGLVPMQPQGGGAE